MILIEPKNWNSIMYIRKRKKKFRIKQNSVGKLIKIRRIRQIMGNKKLINN